MFFGQVLLLLLDTLSKLSTYILQWHTKSKPRPPERHLGKETNKTEVAERRMFISKEVAV